MGEFFRSYLIKRRGSITLTLTREELPTASRHCRRGRSGWVIFDGYPAWLNFIPEGEGMQGDCLQRCVIQSGTIVRGDG